MVHYEVYVKRLPTNLRNAELRDFFSDCGPMVSTWVEPSKDKPHTYGFLRFRTLEGAMAAVKKHGIKVGNNKLIVEMAKSTKRFLDTEGWPAKAVKEKLPDKGKLPHNLKLIDSEESGQSGNFPRGSAAQNRNNSSNSFSDNRDEQSKSPFASSKPNDSSDIKPVEQEVPSNMTLSEFMDNYAMSVLRNDPINYGFEQHVLVRINLEETAQSKLQRKVVLRSRGGGDPNMYCFVNAETDNIVFKDILYDEKKSADSFVGLKPFRNKWKTFENKARDRIFAVLQQLQGVSYYLERTERKWNVRLLYDYENESEDSSQGLVEYGGEPIHEGVIGSRTKEEFVKYFRRVNLTDNVTHKFVSAFKSEMASNLAGDAVYTLLDSLCKVVQLQYGHACISNVYFGLSGCLSKSSLSLNGSSGYSGQGQSSDDAMSVCSGIDRLATKDSTDSLCGSSSSYYTALVSKSSETHYLDAAGQLHQGLSCDVHAIFSDELSNGQYLILANIVSGKTQMAESKANVIKDLVYVLQAQEVVFGLLVSSTEAILIRAMRCPNQEIGISCISYDFLTPGDSFGAYTFDSTSLQKLFMDCLSCFMLAMDSC